MKDCGIVKDLLPLYAEDLASEESSAFVKEHLDTCESCRAVFDALKAPVEPAESVAPLRAVRRAVKKRGWLIAGLIACLVAALLLSGFARLTKPIPVSSVREAFADDSIEPETIPIVNEQPETGKTDETDLVRQVQGFVIIADREQTRENESQSVSIVLQAPSAQPDETPKPYSEVQLFLQAPEDEPSGETGAVLYAVPSTPTDSVMTLEPEAVLAYGPQKLVLTANANVQSIAAQGINGELSVTATTTLWRQWFKTEGEPVRSEIDLSDVDAVFFEPYNNTDRETLYLRDGYEPEAGFALPRLVINYYFMIALIGTAVLFVVWLVLLLTKKRKARKVFDILLILAGGFTLAFLAAGFPATTISPLRDMMFVCVIGLLLIGAGLCGRGLLRRE